MTLAVSMYGRIELGWAEIEPSAPVIAGSIGDWRLTYHVGALGIDDGGTIKIAMRFASDWGTPQNGDPTALNYFTASTTGVSTLKARFDRKGYYRPWQKAIVIDVLDDALAPRDTVTLNLQNSEAQTFCERTFEFRVAVDCFGAGVFADLPEQPELEIVNGPPAELVLVTPTQAVVGEPFRLGVKLEDMWGNPCRDFEGKVRLRPEAGLSGLPKSAPVGRIEGIIAREPGIVQICASFGELRAVSPPIEVRAEAGEYRPFWGDLHAQSEETIGTNPIEDYWTFARDRAFLDFCGHQGNDFQITPEFWLRVKDTAAKFHEPGRFVTIPGYEWSAVHPNGGDRNVHLLEDDPEIFRSSRWQAPNAPAETECNDVDQLFNRLRGTSAIVVAHVGGRPANLAFHDDEIEPLIEVASAWGKFEWMIEDALSRGYVVGFCAGSDDHKGRPGASYPGRSFFGWYGGLTCVLAKELTREAIFEALKARRCYATTGQRMILQVTCDGHMMGEEYRADGPRHISIRAADPGLIERVELFRNMELLASWADTVDAKAHAVRISWGGARIRGRGRNIQWDGFLEVSGSDVMAALPYAMDSPAETVSLEGNRVTWRSCTAGDDDGVILTLLDPKNAVIHFESPLLKTDVRASDLPKKVELGGVGLHVTFEVCPTPLDDVAVEFVDEYRGSAAYWVRVTQSDGNLAWSSPIYASAE